MTTAELWNQILEMPKSIAHLKVVILVREHAQGADEIWEREIVGMELAKSQYNNETVLVLKS